MPSSRSTPSVVLDSSQTNGRVAVDSHSIGSATKRDTVSGNIWPTRLGTSSPKMMVRKVMISTTSAVALMSAARARRCSISISQAASGAENAASPTMPLSTPIEVMPICTVDSQRVGCSCRSIAAWAPASPASAITVSRALRAAVSAISDMANRPFRQIRKTSSATSIERRAVEPARPNRSRGPPA